MHLELAMLSSRWPPQLVDVACQAGLALAFKLDDNGRNGLIVGDLENNPSADEVQVREAIVGFVKQNSDRHGFKLTEDADELDT